MSPPEPCSRKITAHGKADQSLRILELRAAERRGNSHRRTVGLGQAEALGAGM